MAHKPTITFRRTKPRLWAGNGFGYNPAEYAVVQDGCNIATLQNSGLRWNARMEGEAWLHAERLADLKANVRRALENT